MRRYACFREAERYAFGALREANVRQDEADELVISIEPERELHVVVTDSIQSLEEVRIVSQLLDLAREYDSAMLTVRPSGERGRANHGWLDSRHTFSFADYHDPAHMGFRSLRVINEDRVQPGQGFGTHPHRDMEIVSYVLEGALEHRDSMGTGSIIRPGDVQRMSAGTGVTHSEYNASKIEPVHFLQIWLLPSERGIAPGYEQKAFAPDTRRGRLRLVASSDGRDAGLTIHANASMYAGSFDPGESAELPIDAGRHAWVQVTRGKVRANGVELESGDGAALSNEVAVRIEGVPGGEVLVFDLA
jgi:redox-sensitive bicupin YhaK (pirin superfamily)